MTHNGWTNWETWEAFNMLSSYDDIFIDATLHARHGEFEPVVGCLNRALRRAGADKNHISLVDVNWKELDSSLKGEG